MYDGPDSDVQGVSVVPAASSRSKTVHLRGLAQPTLNEVAAMMSLLKGWKMPALVVDLSGTGFAYRAKWSKGEIKVTQENLDRANRCLSRRIDGQILMNKDFIWYARTGASRPTS